MTLHMLSGGEARPATGDRTFSRNDPVTGEAETVAAAASVADALAALMPHRPLSRCL